MDTGSFQAFASSGSWQHDPQTLVTYQSTEVPGCEDTGEMNDAPPPGAQS